MLRYFKFLLLLSLSCCSDAIVNHAINEKNTKFKLNDYSQVLVQDYSDEKTRRKVKSYNRKLAENIYDLIEEKNIFPQFKLNEESKEKALILKVEMVDYKEWSKITKTWKNKRSKLASIQAKVDFIDNQSKIPIATIILKEQIWPISISGEQNIDSLIEDIAEEAINELILLKVK